jgi:hypothetical protein
MKLSSSEGAFVELTAVRYEFPRSTRGGPGGDWDANWLIVRARVRMADGRSWSFEDPCLTTWEARSLGRWLHGVVSGQVTPAPFEDGDDAGLEAFTEPNVALGLAARTGEEATVRMHLSLEARPGWLPDDESVDVFRYFVAVRVPLAEVARAADDWDQELVPFPQR